MKEILAFLLSLVIICTLICVNAEYVDEYDIEMRYLDLDGNEICKSTEVHVSDGEPVFLKAKNVDGYICVSRPELYYYYPTNSTVVLFYYVEEENMDHELTDVSLPYEEEYFDMLEEIVLSQ